MIQGLKISMIAWGVIGVLYGLALIVFPNQLLGLFGVSPGAELRALLHGAARECVPSIGIFVILASRDPLKHILWVQLALAWAVIDWIASLIFILRGDLTFLQAGNAVVVDVVMLAAFLIFYPWRKAPSRATP